MCFSLRLGAVFDGLVEVRPSLGEVCSDDSDGGDGGGLGAEDSRAEGDGLPGVDGEELELFGGPAAFGAHGEGDGMGGGVKGGLERGRLLDLAEKNPSGGRLRGEGCLQGGRVGDLGDGGAAGLLRGFEGDATPAVDALARGRGKVFFGTAGEDGSDALDAELSGLFDGPLEVIELEDGEQQVEREGGVSLELFVQGEADAVGSDCSDLSAMEKATGDEVVDLTRLGAEDSGEMGGLLPGQGGGLLVAVPGVGDEAAAGHGG